MLACECVGAAAALLISVWRAWRFRCLLVNEVCLRVSWGNGVGAGAGRDADRSVLSVFFFAAQWYKAATTAESGQACSKNCQIYINNDKALPVQFVLIYTL